MHDLPTNVSPAWKNLQKPRCTVRPKMLHFPGAISCPCGTKPGCFLPIDQALRGMPKPIEGQQLTEHRGLLGQRRQIHARKSSISVRRIGLNLRLLDGVCVNIWRTISHVHLARPRHRNDLNVNIPPTFHELPMIRSMFISLSSADTHVSLSVSLIYHSYFVDAR